MQHNLQLSLLLNFHLFLCVSLFYCFFVVTNFRIKKKKTKSANSIGFKAMLSVFHQIINLIIYVIIVILFAIIFFSIFFLFLLLISIQLFAVRATLSYMIFCCCRFYRKITHFHNNKGYSGWQRS